MSIFPHTIVMHDRNIRIPIAQVEMYIVMMVWVTIRVVIVVMVMMMMVVFAMMNIVMMTATIVRVM